MRRAVRQKLLAEEKSKQAANEKQQPIGRPTDIS
jgi:hypothetical protein